MVDQQSGSDEMWIYAASPDGDDPLPVVVYAHGQGATNLYNCEADGPPAHDDVAPSIAIADALARQGYLAIAVFYRNVGDVSPTSNALEFRDHFTLDTRSLLAAAQWGRTVHGRGSAAIAFLGSSMGTYPAFLAGTTRPEWEVAHEGLDVRAVVMAGMFLNHLSNIRQNFRDLSDSAPDSVKVQSIFGAGLFMAPLVATSMGRGQIELADFEVGAALRVALSAHLNDNAIDLYRDLFVAEPPTDEPACESVTTRAVCSMPCANAVVAAAFENDVPPIRLPDWIKPDALALLSLWDPVLGADPNSATADSPIGLARDLSPVYLSHEMVTPLVLPLLSSGDHTFENQGQAAADVLRDLLVELGVTQIDNVPRIDSDSSGACGHSDYFITSRPDCGWRATTDTLEAAFAD